MIKILIIDDHPLVIEGIKTLLNDDLDLQIAGTAMNAFEAMDFLKKESVDIALIDINLPDVSGIDLCKKIVTEFPKVRCIALTTFWERSYVTKMIKNGAMGYLHKGSSKDEIIKAAKQVFEGGYYMNVNTNEPLASEINHDSPNLTPREKEVLKLIAKGLTNQEIAEKLFVSSLTIKSHRTSLLLKFNVSNTASLINIATQNDLI
ncbi:MAG: response regulator [Leadbetterella sp.]